MKVKVFDIYGIIVCLIIIILSSKFNVYAQNTSFPVGSIQGIYDVNETGTAIYQIPIEVVPGTKVIQPNLSITYNSMSECGILGNGWNISGISAIERVGQNSYLDRNNSSITLTYNDRFALDGNRLVCSNLEQYGLHNANYRSEFENFSKIISYNQQGNGPQYFKIFRDDGSIAEYGNTIDSRQILGNSIYKWFINKVTDINGNYMTFHFSSSGSEVWIDHIDYTGNENASLSPFARVKFEYETYQHLNSFFVAGYEIPQTKILKSISVLYLNNENYEFVRQYRFSYSNNFPKKLINVELVASDSRNLNPTTIDWIGINSNDKVITSLLPINNLESTKRHIAMDFNKDGLCDMFVYGLRTFYLYQNDGGNFVYHNQKYTASSSWEIQKCVPADIDGDGFSEMVTVFTDPNRRNILVTTTKYPFETDTVILPFYTSEYKDLVTGDFLGNGQDQIILLYKKGESFYINMPSTNLTQIVSNGVIEVIDYDGDGQIELMILDENSSSNATIYKYNEQNNHFYEIGNHYLSNRFVTSGNFNSDGISDLLLGNGTNFNIALGTGAGYSVKPQNIYFGLHNTMSSLGIKPIVVDINNDGYDDVIAFNKVTDGLKVVCYVGSGYYDGALHFENSIPPPTLPIILETFELSKHDFTFGDFNNDHKLDLISFKTIDATHDGVLLYEFRFNKRNQLVETITSGIGSFVKWYYGDIHGLYHRYSSHISVLPFGYNIVKSMTFSLGIENQTNTINYNFKNPVYSFARQQTLGFLSTSVYNANNNSLDSTQYNNVIGENGVSQDMLMPYLQKTFINNQLINTKSFQPVCLVFNNNLRRLPYIIKTIDTNHLYKTVETEINVRMPNTGKPWTYSRNVKNHDDINPQYSELSEVSYSTQLLANGAFVTNPTYIYSKSWMNNSSIISESEQYFTYNNRFLLKQTKTITDGVISSLDMLEYDDFGNAMMIKFTGDSCQDFLIAKTYDNTGRFCIRDSSGVDFITNRTYSPKTGLIKSATDENNLTTSYNYDGFSRLTSVYYPDGISDSIKYKWYNDSEIDNAKYYTVTHRTGRTYDTEQYYDLLGRNITTRKNGTYTDTCYDLKGRIYRISEPYMRGTSNENKIWHHFQYDNFGRIVGESGPYYNRSYQYNAKNVVIKDNLRQTISKRTFDAVGRLNVASDPGGIINYSYSTIYYSNKPAYKTSINACGNTTNIISDARGNRLSITDPNAGTVTCVFDAHNQLLQQTDARGNIVKLKYDERGKVVQKIVNDTETITYEYDCYSDSNRGIGKPCKIFINDTLSEQFVYDSLSRLAQHIRYIDGEAFTESYSYNSRGQLSTLTYPNGFAVDYSYTWRDNLSKITNHNSNKIIYQVYNYNIYNQPLKCGYGNATATEYEYNDFGLVTRIKTGLKNYGMPYIEPPVIIGPIHPASINFNTFTDSITELPYTVDTTIQSLRYYYDDKGRLVQQTQKSNQFETYQYDNLDRLTTFTQGTVGGDVHTFTTTYDGQGNILTNTLAGSYDYDSNKPHAVTSILPNDTFPDAISAAMCQTEYNAFNKPIKISESNIEILLEYNADNQRVKTIYKRNGQTELTRYHISANYEMEKDAAGVVTHYNYVYGATGLAAICVQRNDADSMYYVYTDRLGSYTHIANSDKQTIRNIHFDPWGNVKSDTNWLAFDTTSIPDTTHNIRFHRGFTGHEHYAELKIINMNGRLYDPVIARFFSPDNFVQAPAFTQSYNRYSYCLNNPLQYVDPSGEFAITDWYIDAKRNVQWFESTSDYYEQNGVTYARIGSTMNAFLPNGQMVFGDAQGVIHAWIQEIIIKPHSDSNDKINKSSGYNFHIHIDSEILNSLSGFAMANGVKTNLIDYAVRNNFNDSKNWRQFDHLKDIEKNARKIKVLGESGTKYLNISRKAGTAATLVSTGFELVNYASYTANYGFDWQVSAKLGLDITMTMIGIFGGPVGFAISSTYFILDVSTDGFRGFGKMY